MSDNIKRFYRSSTDKVIGGIIGGLAEYWHVDSTVLRIGWLAITIFSGLVPGILIYILSLAIVPVKM